MLRRHRSHASANEHYPNNSLGNLLRAQLSRHREVVLMMLNYPLRPNLDVSEPMMLRFSGVCREYPFHRAHRRSEAFRKRSSLGGSFHAAGAFLRTTIGPILSTLFRSRSCSFCVALIWKGVAISVESWARRWVPFRLEM